MICKKPAYFGPPVDNRPDVFVPDVAIEGRDLTPIIELLPADGETYTFRCPVCHGTHSVCRIPEKSN